MADTSYTLFYNSQDGDRVYDADSFEHLLKRFFTSGVFSGCCQVLADGGGMSCTVGTGYANCSGKVRFFFESTSLAFANAHATYNRIDTVVIERNDTDREISCKVVQGTYAANPVPKAPVRENGIFQLVLAQVYIAAGTTGITQSMITDKRPDTSVCGYVMCAVETPDFSELYSQFEAQAEEAISNTRVWITQYKETAEDDHQEFVDHLADYLSAFQSTIDADEQTAEGDLIRFQAAIQNIIDQLEQIIDSGSVAPLQLQVDRLEEKVNESPWVRPEWIMTDQSGNAVEDFEGFPINITTLSQAEIAAGIINSRAPY